MLASLPLVSILAMVWMYVDTGQTAAITEFSRDVVWLVLPSLILFVCLPALLVRGLAFWPALLASCAATAAGYGLMILARRTLGA